MYDWVMDHVLILPGVMYTYKKSKNIVLAVHRGYFDDNGDISPHSDFPLLVYVGASKSDMDLAPHYILYKSPYLINPN
jgi:hypothetical protein